MSDPLHGTLEVRVVVAAMRHFFLCKAICRYQSPTVRQIIADAEAYALVRLLDKKVVVAHSPHKTPTLGCPYCEFEDSFRSHRSITLVVGT
jgi:hypothetical protein